MPKDSLTVTDNRTGKQYELPIQDGTIHATDLRKIQLTPDDRREIDALLPAGIAAGTRYAEGGMKTINR